MAATGKQQISIGFQGGQVLSLRVADDKLKALYKSLGQTGWHELESEEGPVRLDLAQIVYVRAESSDLKVGFGA
ncbi:MAG TPA: hypothetical protein VMB05_01195 [Solirubrobacteraceae bacterium]|nr:hypothetical protein [Solirubrobacteraceae bacterium]